MLDGPTTVGVGRRSCGAVVIADHDPDVLVARILDEYRTHHFRRPSVFADGRGDR